MDPVGIKELLPQQSAEQISYIDMRFRPSTIISYPKDHWTLKTGYFEDQNTPAIQVRSPFHWRVQDP